MTYKITFDNNMADMVYRDIESSWTWMNLNHGEERIVDTALDSAELAFNVNNLRIVDADTEVRTCNDEGYLLVVFARINKHVFINDGSFYPKELKDALREIAHPETKH